MGALNDLARACNDNAVNKGFYETFYKLSEMVDSTGDPKLIAEFCAIWKLSRLELVTTELAEAAEEVREPGKLSPKIKKELGEDLPAFDEELADALIRLFDLAGSLGIDLDRAVELKMRMNAMRKPMHGGKLA